MASYKNFIDEDLWSCLLIFICQALSSDEDDKILITCTLEKDVNIINEIM